VLQIQFVKLVVRQSLLRQLRGWKVWDGLSRLQKWRARPRGALLRTMWGLRMMSFVIVLFALNLEWSDGSDSILFSITRGNGC